MDITEELEGGSSFIRVNQNIIINQLVNMIQDLKVNSKLP